MKWFKTPLFVCLQNLRKWAGNYKMLLVLIILFLVSDYNNSYFLNFEETLDFNPGMAPWTFVFSVSCVSQNKLFLFLTLLILYCDAPFIDANQTYVISRCSRTSWSLGQILYIMAAGAVYVLTSVFFSIVLLIGNMDLTMGWGEALMKAPKINSMEAILTNANSDVIEYFSPLQAMFYSILLVWLACVLIGLVIYVINSATKKTGFGVLAGGFLIAFDLVRNIFVSGRRDLDLSWLSYISPVTWCSIQYINYTGEMQAPSIIYVLFSYIFWIIALSAVAIMINKKQEIEVIQSV